MNLPLRLRAGSPPWLLAHDLRLAWRDFRSAFKALDARLLAVLILLMFGLLHAAAWPLARAFATADDAAGRSLAFARLAPGVLFVMLLMVAQTLNGVTKLLYARQDLDLLFSSPLSIRTILLVRMLAVAAGALASAAIFVVPLADAAALQGNLAALAFYPAALGAALLAATLSLALAIGLFALIGPRRTRLAAQILATFIGAGFMIGLQLGGLVPGLSLGTLVASAAAAQDPLTLALLLPVRAALGEPGPLMLWLGLTSGSFGLVTLWVAGRFVRNAGMVATLVTPAGRGPARRTARRFGSLGGFGSSLRATLRAKEWRLIARDPWLVSQILLQILYMTPMIVLLWSRGGSIGLALGPMVVVVTFQVASSLTWLSLSGEDAPDLLATAPVSAGTLRRGKIEAVGLLTLAIVGLPLLWLGLIEPAAACATLGLGVLGLGVAVLLQLWHGQPARRSAFAARHRESKLLALIEMGLSMLFGVATALVVSGSALGLIPLALVGAVLLCARPRLRPA
jgi:ABC-2 type transport system permease protein